MIENMVKDKTQTNDNKHRYFESVSLVDFIKITFCFCYGHSAVNHLTFILEGTLSVFRYTPANCS